MLKFVGKWMDVLGRECVCLSERVDMPIYCVVLDQTSTD